MFVGRTKELNALEDAYVSRKSELVVIYGRRRIGKSQLIKEFLKDKTHFFTFEAIEGGRSKIQIDHFTKSLQNQTRDPILDSVKFDDWEKVFSYMTERVLKPAKGNQKTILFFDELQWMAAGRSQLISHLKYYWDNEWKDKNMMLILCGSIASFMIKRVISSKALYGRITLQILLKGLKPNEAARLFRKKRSSEEILKYLLIFGGVPKYLEEIRLDRSFPQNINRLCFSSTAPMVEEIKRIFYSQFRESQTYYKIASLLKKGLFSFQDISQKTKISSGGGLKHYIDTLEQADIIQSFIPFGKKADSKLKRFTLSDEHLTFYYKFIEPNLRTIRESQSNRLFETLTEDQLHVWLGFAFERFCLKYSNDLAKIMGFEDSVLSTSPLFNKGEKQFQIDLIYKRSDKVITVCEVKHHNKMISTKIIPEIERKCALLKIPTGYSLEKALISLYGPDKALHDAGTFDYSVTLRDILYTDSKKKRGAF